MIINKMNKYAEEACFYHDLAGIAIGVSIGSNSPLKYNGLEYEFATGYKNCVSGEKLENNTIFHVASVTKLFVGTSIMLLAEKGLINLDSTINEVLPWFEMHDTRYKAITVRHLLAHTAGLGDVTDYGWDRPELDVEALKRYVCSEEVKSSRLLWHPSENKFSYSNMGYEILGTIIAEVSGVSFEEFVTENILNIVGMNDSTLLTFKRAEGSLDLLDLDAVGLAMPHKKDTENHIVLENQYPYNRAHGPSSTLTTNLSDLTKWAKAHLNKSLLKDSSYHEVWLPQSVVPNNGERIGLSWFIREQNGYTLYGHEGNDDGFRASFWICPELDMHIAVTANISKAPVKKISKRIFDMITCEE